MSVINMPTTIATDEDIIKWLRAETGYDIKRITNKELNDKNELEIAWRTY